MTGTSIIGIPGIWNKFKGKFAWDNQKPAPILLVDKVYPVTVIDDLLLKDSVELYNTSIGVAGEAVVGTVPNDERWVLHAMEASLSTGVWTMSTLYIRNLTGNVLTVKAPVASQTSLQTFPLGHAVPLAPGWGFSVWIDGWTSIGNMLTAMYVTKQKVT